MTDRKYVKPHTYAFQVLARGVWGSVTQCGRAGADHDHDACLEYLRDQRMRWDRSGEFRGADTRLFDTRTGSVLK